MPLGVSPLMLGEVHTVSRFCSISFLQSSMMGTCCWLACFIWDLRSMIIRRKKKWWTISGSVLRAFRKKPLVDI